MRLLARSKERLMMGQTICNDLIVRGHEGKHLKGTKLEGYVFRIL